VFDRTDAEESGFGEYEDTKVGWYWIERNCVHTIKFENVVALKGAVVAQLL
jgi:hypothetical protein